MSAVTFVHIFCHGERIFRKCVLGLDHGGDIHGFLRADNLGERDSDPLRSTDIGPGKLVSLCTVISRILLFVLHLLKDVTDQRDIFSEGRIGGADPDHGDNGGCRGAASGNDSEEQFPAVHPSDGDHASVDHILQFLLGNIYFIQINLHKNNPPLKYFSVRSGPGSGRL